MSYGVCHCVMGPPPNGRCGACGAIGPTLYPYPPPYPVLPYPPYPYAPPYPPYPYPYRNELSYW